MLPSQPDVFRRLDLPTFDELPQIDCAYCSTLRVAHTLREVYATKGLDLEEVGLAHTMEGLLYTIPHKNVRPHWGLIPQMFSPLNVGPIWT